MAGRLATSGAGTAGLQGVEGHMGVVGEQPVLASEQRQCAVQDTWHEILCWGLWVSIGFTPCCACCRTRRVQQLINPSTAVPACLQSSSKEKVTVARMTSAIEFLKNSVEYFRWQMAALKVACVGVSFEHSWMLLHSWMLWHRPCDT